jgi:CubicO group peptidase (beta-lactamase class C family)
MSNRILNRFFLILFCVLTTSLLFSHAETKQPIDLQKIDQYLQTKYEKGNIPGFAVAIVDSEVVLFSKGYGKNSDNQAITEDTPFAIASLSKAFTALSVMQLVEAGEINLDDDIGKYLPVLSGKGITVRNLLNQTSGFSDLVFPEMKLYNQPENLDEAVNRMKDVTLATKPGEKYRYHNPNYTILAKLVEIVSGENFSDYLHQHIFQPLHMKHTADRAFTDDFYQIDNLPLPQGYNFILGYPVQLKEPEWFVEGSAGMLSSAADMANWMKLFLNEGGYGSDTLLRRAGNQHMLTPPATNPYYGMGWALQPNGDISHNGMLWTSQSELLILKEKGYGIIVLFNSGLNIFENYNSFITGISDILHDREPATPSFPTYWPELLIAAFLLLSVCLSLRQHKRIDKWERRYQSKFKFWLRITGMLIPLILLLLLPQTVPFLSGRVLNWERTFWTMSSIVILLGGVSLLNIGLIVKIFSVVFKKK